MRPFTASEAGDVLDLRVRNRTFIEPFEPRRPETHFTLPTQVRMLEDEGRAWRAGLQYVFGIFDNDDDALIGRLSLSNVVRGGWHNATVGYFVDEANNGRGVATEALKLAVDFGFQTASLHRIQAGVMPHNVASIRVVEKAGFRYEGLALRYLCINGVWEDHNIYAVTAEEWSPVT
ncbi:MAG: [ribosomal protein S5]-alanine N-acetyltransferase [Acidimicrobiaceae bacterium]|jgi:ribosomal-protein-alanine N-acetyltransferase